MKKFLSYSLIAGVSSAIYYYIIHPIIIKERNKFNKKENKEKQSLFNLIKKIEFKEKEELFYNKKIIIEILKFIKIQSKTYIEKFQKEYRENRRKHFDDIGKYKDINNELNNKLQRIITRFTKILFTKKSIDQDKFDKSIEKFQEDNEISYLLNNLCTFE